MTIVLDPVLDPALDRALGGRAPSPTDGELARLARRELLTSTLSDPPGVQVRVLVACPPQRLFDLFADFERLPGHIYGLERAEVLAREVGAALVRFTMKLPFPAGRIAWTNRIETRHADGLHTIRWSLVDGDLRVNEGALVLATHQGRADLTDARYQVRVETRTRLPKAAERLATRWLLPRIVDKLRVVAEHDSSSG